MKDKKAKNAFYKHKYDGVHKHEASIHSPMEIRENLVDEGRFSKDYGISYHYINRYLERIIETKKTFSYKQLENLAHKLGNDLPVKTGLSTIVKIDGVTSIIRDGIAVTCMKDTI